MVGAIVLARRDLIPESTSTTTALTLPERPRELAATISESRKD